MKKVSKRELITFAETLADSLESVANKISAIENIINGDEEPEDIGTGDVDVEEEEEEDINSDTDESVVDSDNVEEEETFVEPEQEEEEFSTKTVKAKKVTNFAANPKAAADRYQTVKDFLSGKY